MRSILILISVLLLDCIASASVTAHTETKGAQTRMVLENDAVRLVVVPNPGGSVVEFVNKKTGTNFVFGGENLAAGRLGHCWKDFYPLTSREHAGKFFYHLPYTGRFGEGPGYKSIIVVCDAEGQRVEREMRLGDASAELLVFIKLTNISEHPQRLQIRFHPYSIVADPYAENSAIVTPLANGEIGKLLVGAGFDQEFITHDGYWLAGNHKTGEGLWMTYRKDQSQVHMTWTDYKFQKHPARGAFVAEPYPVPVLGQPGQTVEYACSFYPYTAEESSDAIPMGVLADAGERERAVRFLSLVKPNLQVVAAHTMRPAGGASGQAVADQNRFSTQYSRRDRMALRPWGILDAMVAVNGNQATPARCRYYARLFDSQATPIKVKFRLSATDARGRVVREQTREFTIDPAAGRELDVRDDVPIADLPDGWYTVSVDGFVEGESQSIHHYEDKLRLVGKAWPQYEKQQAQPKTLVERPFVTALRTVELSAAAAGAINVPIGVEDAGGVARQNWPVRLGVPFARGAVPTKYAVELRSPQGQAVPVQAEVTSTWPDGSLKWLLVSFGADVPADSHVFYTLSVKAGESTTLQPIAVETADTIAVDTGGLKFAWDKAGDKLFGVIDPADLWWEDGTGKPYTFRLTGEDAGWVIEETGPARAVVRATGWYFNDADRPVAMGELRMEYYAGRQFVRLFHTVMFAGDPWRQTLGSYGIRLAVGQGQFDSVAAAVDRQVFRGNKLSIFQRDADTCDVSVDAGAAQELGRAMGSVQFTSPSKKLALHHVDFWRLAPKTLDADAAAGTVTYAYWPREAGAMSFLPREDGWLPSSSTAGAVGVGMSRTQELVIDFAPEPAAGPELAERTFAEPVIAVVPPRYLSQTAAMLHLSPYDPQAQPEKEQYISDTIDFYTDQRELFGWYGQWNYGALRNHWQPSEHRWADFGRTAWILNEMDIVHAPWLCYARSGDRKYLRFASSNTRHLMEVATIRWNPVWAEEVGLSRRHHECIWLGNGDRGHSMLDPFMDCYFLTGYRPAWDAARRLADGMTHATTGSWRYLSNPIAALSRMYLETHDPAYKQHADRIWNDLCYPEQNLWWGGDHGDRMVMWYSQVNPQCDELWRAWSLNPQKSGRFEGVDALSALFHKTGEAKYADAVRKAKFARPSEWTTQFTLTSVRAWCYASIPFPANAGGLSPATPP